MGRLECRDNALQSARQLEGRKRLLVGDRDVFDAAQIVQPSVLGADAGIIETCGNRMRVANLPILILQQVGAITMQYAGPTARQRGRVQSGFDAMPTSLNADHRHSWL